jgi:hypothetical protein
VEEYKEPVFDELGAVTQVPPIVCFCGCAHC